MNEKQMRYFVRIAELKSFAKAAEEMYISQQALSKAIKNLETEYELPVFFRSSQGIELSPFGEYLYPNAKMIIKKIDEMIDEVENEAKRSRNTFSLAFGRTTSIALSMETINKFENLHPEIHMEKRFLTGLDYINHVKMQYADLAYGPLPVDFDGIEYIPLVSSEPVALMSVNNPLAEREHIKLEDLKPYSIAMLANNQAMKQRLIGFCVDLGFTPKTVMEIPEISLLQDLVYNDKAIQLLPPYALKTFFSNGMVYKRLNESPYTIELGFVYNKEKGLKDIAKEFVEFAMSNKPRDKID